jgi:hypothetical protein
MGGKWNRCPSCNRRANRSGMCRLHHGFKLMTDLENVTRRAVEARVKLPIAYMHEADWSQVNVEDYMADWHKKAFAGFEGKV